MRIILTLLLLSAAAPLLPAPAVRRVGVYQSPPLSTVTPDGRVDGFFPEYLNSIARMENFTIKYYPGEWRTLLPMLLRGELDLILCVGDTPERRKQLQFPDDFLYTDWITLFSRHHTPLKSLHDLAGKTVAAFSNSLDTRLLQEELKKLQIPVSFRLYSSYPEVFRAVAETNADAAVCTRSSGVFQNTVYGLMNTEIYFAPVRISIAFASNRAARLREILQHHLRRDKCNPDSKYFSIYRKWFPLTQEQPGLPRWLIWIVLGTATLLPAGGGFVLLLRRQVRQKTAALQTAEQRFRLALESVPFPVLLHSENGTVELVNRKWEEQSGYQFAGRSTDTGPGSFHTLEDWVGLTNPAMKQELLQHITSLYRLQQETDEGEFILRSRRGEPLTWHFYSVPLGNDEQGKQLVLSAAVDITAQKRLLLQLQNSLRDKEALLKEIHHRVKNNLQLISSLISLQADRAGTPEATRLLQLTGDRIKSIAMIHNLLYNAPEPGKIDFCVYLAFVIKNLRQNPILQNIPAEVKVLPGKLQLPTHQAVPAALICNELLTNALQHAFPPPHNNPGSVTAACHTEAGIHTITVTDNGCGSGEREAEGLGFTIVHTMAKQLKGNAALQTEPGRTVWTITFPAE